MRFFFAVVAQGAGFWLAIEAAPAFGPWAAFAIFAGAWASACILAPRPIKSPPETTSRVALERLFWVTGYDRIRTRAPRVLWWSEL